MSRDLKADLEAIREGATLFGDPNPGVNTQYELYEVAEHAIERAIEAEALVRELVGVIDELRRQINECGLDGEMWDVYQRAKEVLGDGDQAK